MCIFFFASGEKLLVRVQSGPRAVVSDLFLQLRHGTAYLAAGSRTADFLCTPLRGVVLALGSAAASFVVPRVGTPFREPSPVVSVLLGCHGAVCSCMGRFFLSSHPLVHDFFIVRVSWYQSPLVGGGLATRQRCSAEGAHG